MAEYVLGRMQPPRQARFTIRDFLVSLFFHKRAILVAFCIPVCIGVAAAAMSKLVFISDARLLVLLGSQYVLQPDSERGGASLSFDRNQIIQSEIEILQSEDVLKTVLRKLGIDHIYPPGPPGVSIGGLMQPVGNLFGNAPKKDDIGDRETLAAARLRSDLSITSVPQSNVIALSFRHADRLMSAEVLNTIIATYIERRGEIFRRSRLGGSGDERDQYAARLRDAEAELARFAEDTHISSFDEQVTLLLRDQATLVRDIHETEQRLSAVSAQVDTMRRQAGQTPQTVELFSEQQRSQVAATLTDQLLRLEAQRRDLMSRYKPDFPPVADVNRQIAELHRQIAGAGGQNATQPQSIRRGQNPSFVEQSGALAKLEVERDGLVAQRGNQLQAQQVVQNRLDQLNQIGSRYRELKRTRDVLEETYRNFVRNSEQALLADEMDRGQLANIRIIQPAEPPPFGTRPRKLLLMASLAVGVMAAVAIFWVMSALRQTMIGVTDAERELQLPVLVAVPDRRGLTYGSGRRNILFRGPAANDGMAKA